MEGQYMEQTSGLAAALRQDAGEYSAKQIDVQSIYFRQGREIARTYVDMMRSYARLDAQSGRFEQHGDARIVTGFCRIEEHHFGTKLLHRTRKQSFWTAQWTETVEFIYNENDLFAAFLTSFAEFCRHDGIETGALCALVRTKDGTLEQRPFPVTLTQPAYLEGIGFPYQIAF